MLKSLNVLHFLCIQLGYLKPQGLKLFTKNKLINTNKYRGFNCNEIEMVYSVENLENKFI